MQLDLGRLVLGAALFAVASTALGQTAQGNYKPGGKGAGVDWQINSHYSLVWDHSPYLPIGLNVDANPTAITAAKNAGFSDVLVDLPASEDGWQSAIDTLAKTGMKFVIRINSLTPMAHGIAVDPAAYRISDLTVKRHLAIPMPDATEALVVIADSRDGSVESWSRVSIADGVLKFDAQPGPVQQSVVLVYPRTVSLQQPDYWEGMDDHRDSLLTSLKRHAPGGGLRGIVNPLGRCLTLPASSIRFVPTSSAFKEEFAELLDSRYRNVVSALRAWSLQSDVVASTEVGESKDAYHSFSELASLVPLWSGTRGVADIWDPERNKVYSCDKSTSAIWKDYADAISAAEDRRFARMVGAIREVVDVPVIQEWAGWAPPYETGKPTVDGIGMKSVGVSPTSIFSTAAKSTSSMLRWPNPGWLAATEIDLEGADAAAQVGGVIDDLDSLGARGIFFKTASPEVVKAIVAEAAKRQSDASIANYSPAALFYPENASNPAVTQRLPGGKWWLPCPADGNRIDYGYGFFGYRMTDRNGPREVIWTRKPARVILHLASPAKAVFTSCDGSDVHPKLVKKTGVEVDLSENPLIVTGDDEIPIPDPAYQSASSMIGAILNEAKERHMSFEEEQMTLTDAYKGFDRNPGGAYSQIRDIIHQVASEIGDFSWIEAERTDANNFSEVLKAPGCSAGAALDLHASIDLTDTYYADYGFEVHSQNDQQLWLAARIPPEDRRFVTIRIGSQTFGLTGEPIGLYADGFGWYHLGVTRLLEADAKLRVSVVGPSPDMAIDVIALAPSDFKPDGVYMPDPKVVPIAKPKKKKGRGGILGGILGG